MSIAGIIEDAFYEITGQRKIRYLQPVKLANADSLIASTCEQVRREFLLGPPLILHAPRPEIFTGLWCAFRESLIAGPARRVQRETIAQGVAERNQCPYCADVHGMMVDGATASDGTETQAFREWVLATRAPGAAILAHPPFSSVDAPQMIGTALVFHYLNRMVNVFLGESPLPAPSNRLLRGVATSVFAKRIVSVRAAPGESLRLLPSAGLPPAFRFLDTNEFVAGAFARFHAAVSKAAAATLSEEVLAWVDSRLGTWQGEDPGLGTAWLEEASANVSVPNRPAARLVLLTALASYRVDDQVIADFRERHPTDANLIAATAWGSFAAMRRTASWLGTS